MHTILGPSGFIGSSLVRRLERGSLPFRTLGRDEPFQGRHLGHVVYCIGLTGDFRFHRHDTVEAHVCKVERLLHDADFESFTYLSSTRLYRKGQEPACEDNPISVHPTDADDLYNISKAMGESLLLASTKLVKVIRLSHVYGLDWASRGFLSSVITDAVQKGRVVLHSAMDSERDYISIDDVVELILRISTGGSHRLYNVASGTNVSNARLVSRLADLTGCTVDVDPGASTVRFPRIDTTRITEDFGFRPHDLLDDVVDLVKQFELESGRRA